jgi:hypothetical protein
MEKRFKTTNGDNHLIDSTGNHFINGKCVNPLKNSLSKIGSTYPNNKDILK